MSKFQDLRNQLKYSFISIAGATGAGAIGV